MTKLTEKAIQKKLYGFIAQPRYIIENLYVFDWESEKTSILMRS